MNLLHKSSSFSNPQLAGLASVRKYAMKKRSIFCIDR